MIVSYTVFDIINRAGSTFKRLVTQCGKGTVQRRFVKGIPQSFKAMQSVKVLVELTKAEFALRNTNPHWEQFRASDSNNIKTFLKALPPSGSIVELPKSVQWRYWDTEWETA